MSNKTLKATIKLDTKQAERNLNNIVKAINKVNDAANRSGRSNQKVNDTLNRAVGLTEKLKENVNKASDSSSAFNKRLQKSEKLLDSMVSKMKRLAGIYLGVMGGRALFTTVDNITASENRLNNVNAKITGDDPSDGYSTATTNATTESINKMYAASQRARTGYNEMMANVSKSMVLAGDAFGNNMDNAIAFQETMAKAYTVGGASAAEQASSMYQMIQALGSGILQGDELRSVREGAPLAYKAIEEFAQGVYNTEESLKELASQGKITSDMVVAAISNASDSINESFNASAMTWAQAWIYIKNVVVDSIRPIQDTLNEFLSSDAAQVLLVAIENVIRFLAAALNWVLSILSSVITWFVDNWYWVQWIVYAGLTLITLGLLKMAAQAALTGAIMLAMWLISLNPIQMVVLGIFAVIALLAFLFGSVQSAVGNIVGVIYAALSLISDSVKNLFIFIFNLFAGLWEYTKAWTTNVGIAFVNCWNTARSAFWEFVADCLEGLKGLEPYINAIAKVFGAEGFTLSGLTSSLHAKANNYTLKEYVDQDAAFNRGFNTFKYEDAFGNAKTEFNHGYELGSNAVNWIGSKLSNLTNKFKNKYGSESIGALDPSVALNTTSPDSAALGNISDNTDKIADSMDLTQEDLEYLRKLAQLEWKKEYTTNSININMTNNNNVNSDSDLDGIVTKLTDKLYEELSVTASGVYA